MKSVGQDDAQKALTLHDFLNDKDIVQYAKAAGYWPSVEREVAMHMISQMRKHRSRMLESDKDRPRSVGRRINSDKQGADEALLAAVANSPGRSKSNGMPSQQAVGSMLGIPKGSRHRKLKRAEEKRKALKAGVVKERWSSPKKRKSHKKTSSSLRKKVRGWIKRNKMMVHYNYRTDPDLGIGRCAARRIACRCEACDKQLQEPWISGKPFSEQPRYAQNSNCKYWEVFQGMNDWIELISCDGKDTDREVVEEANQCALDNVAEMMASEVKVGGYGAMDTDDPNTDGYYLVNWKGLPFTAQAQMETREGDVIQKGELVCEACHVDTIPGEHRCFKATNKETVVRMQYILAANVETSKSRTGGQRYDRIVVSEEEHDAIIDEIDRRERIDHEEDVADAIEDGEESDNDADDGGEDAEDNSSDNE